MLPVLQIGPFAIPTHPLALVLAGWVALAVAARAGQRLGVDGDHVYNAGLYGLIGGVIGARAAHVVAFWPAYRSQPLEIFGFNTNAFLFWPGLVAALIVAGWYVYRRRLPLAPLLDAFTPGLLVGLAIAALGALLSGRNAGAPADLPWSVSLWGVRRHPVQVYEALGLAAVAFLVLSMLRSGARSGAAALTALLGWGLVEWFVEAYRAADVTGTVLGGARAGQVLGLVVAVFALLGLRALSLAADRPGDENDALLSG